MTLLVLLLAAAVIRLWIVTGRLSRRVAQLEAGVASGRIVPAPTVAPKERPALGPAPAWGPGEASAPVAVPTAAAPIGAEPPPRSEPVGADALRWARSLGPWLRANWIYAVAVSAAAVYLAARHRQTIRARIASARIRPVLVASGAPMLVVAATAAQVWMVTERTDSLQSPTSWYYWQQSIVVAATQGVPEVARRLPMYTIRR